MNRLPLKFALPALLAALILPTAARTVIAHQDADAIVEKHIAAIGGREALGKLKTRKATGTATISVQGMDLSGPIETFHQAPNMQRLYISLDLSAMGAPEPMVLDQRFDGNAGWTLNSMQGDQPMTGSQLENMKSSTFPSPMLTYKENGTAITALPNETVAGKSLIVLQVAPKTGTASKVYLDPETYLVVRSVAKVDTPEAGMLEQVNEPSDYRVVDGVKIPFKVVQSNPMQTVTFVLKTVEHNVTLDQSMFKGR
jgi:hypothetical protein